MEPSVVPFHEDFVEASAQLIVDHYRSLRELDPDLPEEWKDTKVRAAAIDATSRAGPGVAALYDGELVGFLLSRLDLGGRVPDGAWPSAASLGGARRARIRIDQHAATSQRATDIYRQMYAQLAKKFLERGCFQHAVSATSCDRTVVESWFGLGFGMDQVLGTRDVSPLSGINQSMKVRRAESGDLDGLVSLATDLQAFHVASPIFYPLFLDAAAAKESFTVGLADDRGGIWVVKEEGELLGMMQAGGGGRTSVGSARPASGVTIGMASVAPSAHRSGVGTVILAEVLKWARETGYERCTVEWSAANLISGRFWSSRGFRPIQYLLVRQLDERIAWANDITKSSDLRQRW